MTLCNTYIQLIGDRLTRNENHLRLGKNLILSTKSRFLSPTLGARLIHQLETLIHTSRYARTPTAYFDFHPRGSDPSLPKPLLVHNRRCTSRSVISSRLSWSRGHSDEAIAARLTRLDSTRPNLRLFVRRSICLEISKASRAVLRAINFVQYLFFICFCKPQAHT